jgi:plasmid stability protein
MAVSLSIKEVPDDLVDALRKRASRNHRSIQGELMHILETAIRPPKGFRVDEFMRRLRALGLSTPAESARMIREDRDRR